MLGGGFKHYWIMLTMLGLMSGTKRVAAFSRTSTPRSFLGVLSTTSMTGVTPDGCMPCRSSLLSSSWANSVSWLLVSKRTSSRASTFLHLASRRSSSTDAKSSSTKEEEEESMGSEETKTLESKWNVSGLKKEVGRQVMRSFKKLDKAGTRLSTAQEVVEQLLTDPDATQKQLDQCPNVQEIEQDLEEKKERHEKLIQLEELLGGMKSKSKPAVLPEEVATLALELGVTDSKPVRQPRGPKKQKGPKLMAPSRLPYRRYYTLDKTEIRVGKQAADNDELSCNAQHRDGSDWWMHASGCPGSHVVIRSDNPSEESLQDAAALAARQSKCASTVIKVNLCRCRDVKKPPGAKAGLVQLVGNVRNISVHMKKVQDRLNRLDETVVVN